METAKVDIRKLQVLNDSINRTIEALNQVRLSVHGVQTIGNPLGGFTGAFGSPYGIAPQLMGQIPGQVPGLVQGIAHSGQTPFGNLGNLGQFGVSPWQAAAQFPGMTQWPGALAQAGAFGANPLAQWAQNGLGHSGFAGGFEQNQFGTDPYTTARIAQTFPFVHWGYSPFAWQGV